MKQTETDEKLKSLVHYIVFCGKQNVLPRGHPNEKVSQQQQFLGSAVQVMVLELWFDKEAGSSENSIAF